MSQNRQTASFLRRRFNEVGLYPETKHGQNFLIDLNLLDLLLRSGEIQKDEVVLEVGTGTASLTAKIAKQAAAVVTVEIDERLYQLASEELIDVDNVTLLQQDVLRNKNNIHDRVLDTVQQKMDETGATRFKLVANLPYNIATPLISNLLLTPIVPAIMSVTIQKELADRITASPRTKDYGALSVWIQATCDAKIIRIMSPNVFWPQPKVQSAIIQIRPNDEKRARLSDPAEFNRFSRAMFFHRRKFMRSVMIAAFKREFTKTQVDEIMHEMELGPTSRSEEQTVEKMIELFHCTRRMRERIAE